ncbi:MAG: hypothetical protein ACREMQ_04630 [Longimicrobiales bacterium]
MIGLLQLAVALNVAAHPATVAFRCTLPVELSHACDEPIRTLWHAQEAARDPWFSQDKFRHAAMSFTTAGFTYAGGRTVGLDRDTALPVALGAAVVASVGKEIYDRRRGRRASYRDLVWDAVGIGASVLLLRAAR